jgi:3-oxoacyl-[acyl-carrier-protein] synthase II
MPRSVVVTGLGVVSPLGNDVSTFWSALLAGRSGVRFLEGFPTDRLRSDVAAQVRGLDASRVLDDKERSLHARVTQMALVAASEAADQARVGEIDPERVGILIGTGQGGVDVIEQTLAQAAARGLRGVSPFFVPTAMPNAATALLSIKRGLGGPSFSVSSACATGSHALVMGALMIAAGEADAVIVGGAEAAILPSAVASFGNARALARSYQGDPARASRPYDAERSGFVIGEGAGVLVIEAEDHARARGAVALARLAGWGMTSDAEHIVRPSSAGRGMARAVEIALRRAGASPADVRYINPHATSTPQGDLAEYQALRAALGAALDGALVSATKSMIGHLLGGASAVETVATVCSLRDRRVHPSINLDRVDEAFASLQLPRTATDLPPGLALKTSSGFGGHNVALLLAPA